MDKTFNAITVEEKKSGEFFQSIKERNIYHLPEGDLLIQVKYSSLNYKDSLSYSGNKGVTKIYPHTPGIDAMGIVEFSKTKDFNKGDKIIITGYDLGMNTPGGFGEYIRVPREWVTLLPENLGDSESMILGTAGMTAGLCVNAMLEKHKIKGEEAIVTGATGGVGIAAVEIAKAYGAVVVACGGNDNKLNVCTEKGADFTINYNNKIIRKELKSLGIKEVDVVIDMVGGQATLDLVKSLNWNGRIIIVGFTSGIIPEIAVNRLLLKNAKADGLYWGELAYREPFKMNNDVNT